MLVIQTVSILLDRHSFTLAALPMDRVEAAIRGSFSWETDGSCMLAGKGRGVTDSE